MKITLLDTFNNVTISSHRTLAAAVKAQLAHARAVKRWNGQSSYIPTRILIDGEPMNEDQATEAQGIAEDLRNA